MIDLNALANGPHLAGNPAAKRVNGVCTRAPGTKRREPTPSGHVAAPGSGPAGETCRSCDHLARVEHSRDYLKCGLNRHNWTGGRKTDVRAGDAACSKWSAKK
jgi:hypothetical protein